MAATVIVANQEQWDFMRHLLDLEGAIVVSPAAAMEYEAKYGHAIPQREIPYDFGDNPDLWVDLVGTGSFEERQSYAAEAIAEAAAHREEEEDAE